MVIDFIREQIRRMKRSMSEKLMLLFMSQVDKTTFLSEPMSLDTLAANA